MDDKTLANSPGYLVTHLRYLRTGCGRRGTSVAARRENNQDWTERKKRGWSFWKIELSQARGNLAGSAPSLWIFPPKIFHMLNVAACSDSCFGGRGRVGKSGHSAFALQHTEVLLKAGILKRVSRLWLSLKDLMDLTICSTKPLFLFTDSNQCKLRLLFPSSNPPGFPFSWHWRLASSSKLVKSLRKSLNEDLILLNSDLITVRAMFLFWMPQTDQVCMFEGGTIRWTRTKPHPVG